MNDPYPNVGTPPGSSPTPPPPAYTVRITQPQNRPVMVYALMGITVFIFILQTLSTYVLGGDILQAFGSMQRIAILHGQYWRFVTPIFLHGSILHIGFNMYALYIIGPGLERPYGHGRFLALYFLSGIAGNVASFILSRSNIQSVGSSTAIFGMLAAQGIFVYQNRRLFGQRTRGLLTNIISIALINLIFGLSLSSVIDNWGHMGGLLGGVIFAALAGPILEVEGTPPDLHLADRRQPITIQLAALGVFVLIAALAIYFITSGNFPSP